MSYTRPQLLVFQEFYTIPVNVIRNLNPFILGPNFKLFRYSEDAEKVNTGIGAYDRTKSIDYLFPNQPLNSAVDAGYTKLFMDNVWAEYLTIPSGDTNPLVSVSAVTRNKLRATPHICPFMTAGGAGVSLGNKNSTTGYGYFVGRAELPGYYYLYPYGGYVGTEWSASGWKSVFTDPDYEDGMLKYITTDNGRGSVAISGASHPIESGVTTVIEDAGLVLDMDDNGRYVCNIPYTADIQNNNVNTRLLSFKMASTTVIALKAVDDFAIGANAAATVDNIVAALYTRAAATPTTFGAIFVEAWNDSLTTSIGTLHIVFSQRLFATDPWDTSNLLGCTFDSTTYKPEASIYAPRTIKFIPADTASSAAVRLAVTTTKYKDAVDSAIDGENPVRVKLNFTPSATNGVGYDSLTKLLTISVNTVGPMTLDALYGYLTDNANIVNMFTVTVAGTTTELTATVYNAINEGWSGASMFKGYDTKTASAAAAVYKMLPDVFRVKVEANDYTWKSGNGFPQTGVGSRDVQVGDRVRWQVTTQGAVTYTCSTRVTGFDYDWTLAHVNAMEPYSGNIGYNESDPDIGTDQTADLSDAHVVPGSDNQRSFNGAYTTINTLSPVVTEFPGDYQNGVISDIFSLEITMGGQPGVAKGIVTNSSGTFRRVDVPVESVPWGAYSGLNTTFAQLYLGNNIYITFSMGAGDGDMTFKVGDTYTFSAPIDAAYDSIDAAKAYSSGYYTGDVNTTYIVDVIRGGVFEQGVTVFDGLNSASSYSINYWGLPASGDYLQLSSVTGDTTKVFTVISGDIGGGHTPTECYESIAARINTVGLSANGHNRLRAIVESEDDNTGTLRLVGPAASMEYGEGLSERYQNATASRSAIFADAMITDWTKFPEVNDEYTLKVISTGNINTTVMSAKSTESGLGDASSRGIIFAGLNSYSAVGSKGLKVSFSAHDKSTRPLVFFRTALANYDTVAVTFTDNSGAPVCRFVYDNAPTPTWVYSAMVDGEWEPDTDYDVVLPGTPDVTDLATSLITGINNLHSAQIINIEASASSFVSNAQAALGATTLAAFEVTTDACADIDLTEGSTIEDTTTGLTATISAFEYDTDHYVLTLSEPICFALDDIVITSQSETLTTAVASVTENTTIATRCVKKASTTGESLYLYVTDGTSISRVQMADDTSTVVVTKDRIWTAAGVGYEEYGRIILSGNTRELSYLTGLTSRIGVAPYTEEAVLNPTFQADNYWIVKVLASRPQVRITSTAGNDYSNTAIVEADTAIQLGSSGAYITFVANSNDAAGTVVTSGGLNKGEKFYVACVASAPGPYKTLILADDINPGIMAGLDTSDVPVAEPDQFAVWMYMVKSGVEVPSKRPLELSPTPTYNWLVDKDEDDNDIITVNDGIYITDDDWYDGSGQPLYMEVYAADMYVNYRALLTDYADTIYSLDDISDVVSTLGTNHPDNPLAYGVYKCMENSGDKATYFMAVPTNDLAGYSSVLDKAEMNNDLYAFGVATQDGEVQDLVEAHINTLSTEENKMWRIAFMCAGLPTMEAILTKATNPGQVDWQGTISSYQGRYRKVTMSEVYPANAVKPGDTVRLNFTEDAWGDVVYDTYEVDTVESTTVFYLKTGLDAPSGQPIKLEVYHPYSQAEIADQIAVRSAAYANRRIGSVFPPSLGANGITVGGEFLACAIAGLRCSAPPQQGLTNIEVNGFDDLPMCYRTFSRTQLNKMAEYGTFIVMQDVAGGTVYVRHQVTSAAQEGNLNTTEFSITTNLDSIAYYFTAVLSPFIGRYNVTPEIIEVVRTQIENGINYLSSYTNVGLLGPQLIKDDGTRKSQIKTLQQHPVLLDRIYCVLNLALPYPLNVIELHLVV